MFQTNSHSSFDFNIFAFNPWELYTQEYKKKDNNNLYKSTDIPAETGRQLPHST